MCKCNELCKNPVEVSVCKDFQPKVIKNYGVYNPNYRFRGTEAVKWDRTNKNEYGKPYCVMNFYDGTKTYAFVDDTDLGGFDLEFGVMLCEAKKFIKKFNFKKLWKVCKNKEALKVIIKEMLKISQGEFIVKDLEDSSKKFNARDNLIERFKNRKKKKAIKWQKRKEKIEALKKEGKWVDSNELKKAKAENERLKRELELKNRVDNYKNLLKENEEMKKELEKK